MTLKRTCGLIFCVLKLLGCSDPDKFAKALGNTVSIGNDSSLKINFVSQTVRVKNFQSDTKSHHMTASYTKKFWNIGGDEHYRNFDKISFSYIDETYALVRAEKIIDPEMRANAEIDISILFRSEPFVLKSCQLKRFGDCGLVLTLLAGDGTESTEFWVTAGQIEIDSYADSSGDKNIFGELQAKGPNLSVNGKVNLKIPRK